MNMEDYFDEIDMIQLVERLIRIELVIRDRTDPILSIQSSEVNCIKINSKSNIFYWILI